MACIHAFERRLLDVMLRMQTSGEHRVSHLTNNGFINKYSDVKCDSSSVRQRLQINQKIHIELSSVQRWVHQLWKLETISVVHTLDDTSSGGIQVFSRNVNVAHAHTGFFGAVFMPRLIPLIYQSDPLIARCQMPHRIRFPLTSIRVGTLGNN